MAVIDEKHWQRLRDAGLVMLEPPFGKGHAWADGMWVGKPVDVKGNCIPDYETGFLLSVDEEIKLDAPPVVFYSRDNAFVVFAQHHVPTIGPGDFVNDFSTPEAAVDDILDFYFGSPIRMNAIAEVKKKTRKRIEDSEKGMEKNHASD